MSVLLETRKVGKSFGVLRALQDVSMAVHEDELVWVVGPNGAGKRTLVNLLTGLLEPSSGEVLFMGETIAGVGPVGLAGPRPRTRVPAHTDIPEADGKGDDRRGGDFAARGALARV